MRIEVLNETFEFGCARFGWDWVLEEWSEELMVVAEFAEFIRVRGRPLGRVEGSEGDRKFVDRFRGGNDELFGKVVREF